MAARRLQTPADRFRTALTDRAVPLPIPAAEIGGFEVRADKVFYLTGPSQMIEGTLPGEKPTLHVYDMKERKDANVADGQ